ncbi:MAG: F0F1 ATP synthase subunit B [Desulfovibrionaceae bacterium]
MKGLKVISTATGLVLLAAGVAFAAEHGGGGAAAHHYDWMNLTWRIANFVVFVFILYKAFGKKASEFFRSRRYAIETELKDLEQRKVDTNKRLDQVNKSIASLDAERAKIIAEYKAQGEVQKAAIIEKAEAAAARITAQAQKNAAQEAQVAVDAMRGEMADLIVAATQKILEEKLSTEEQERLIDNYLTKVVFN